MKNTLPKRKQLRINGYDYSTEGAYFVTICSKNQQNIFGDIGMEENADMVLNDNGKILEKYILNMQECVKHVIMPNHVHLMIILDEDSRLRHTSIPKMINALKSLVSKELGFSCWQRSYHDRVIRNQREFDKVYRYIENNVETWKNDCYHQG